MVASGAHGIKGSSPATVSPRRFCIRAIEPLAHPPRAHATAKASSQTAEANATIKKQREVAGLAWTQVDGRARTPSRKNPGRRAFGIRELRIGVVFRHCGNCRRATGLLDSLMVFNLPAPGFPPPSIPCPWTPAGFAVRACRPGPPLRHSHPERTRPVPGNALGGIRAGWLGAGIRSHHWHVLIAIFLPFHCPSGR